MSTRNYVPWMTPLLHNRCNKVLHKKYGIIGVDQSCTKVCRLVGKKIFSMRQGSSHCSIFYGLLVGLIWLIGVGGALAFVPVSAQESTPVSTPAEAAPPPAGVTADEINTVARELWCPLCSGVRLDACELKACQQMKEMIGLQLAEGENTDSIRDYFVAQYGPQVLGEPTWQGINWLAWVLPFVVLAIGGYVVWTTARRMVRPTPVAAQATGVPANPAAAPADDEYGTKLAEELKRYG